MCMSVGVCMRVWGLWPTVFSRGGCHNISSHMFFLQYDTNTPVKRWAWFLLLKYKDNFGTPSLIEYVTSEARS